MLCRDPGFWEHLSFAAVWLSALPVASFGDPPPWPRTETRADCTHFDTLRQPLFGDLHVHTSFSHDAYIRATRVTPTDAYVFAQGSTVLLPDLSGASTRPATLDRPLDFAAVTDHAEFFGEARECLTPSSPAYNDDLCLRLREITDPDGMNTNNSVFSLPLGFTAMHHAFCDVPGVDCTGSSMTVWQELQAAAETAYDRTSACAFTSLIGYEHTPAPFGAHLHRNVIFRNHVVPALATSYLETKQNGAPQPLWDALETDCLDLGNGCDVVTIPHNSNLSGGMRWPDPPDSADAARRQAREPLVEIYQHKAGSECRFDRLAGLGADTTDELCTFEQDPRQQQGPFAPPPIENYPLRNMVRNALKDGLFFEQMLGVNPFKFGFVGGTDTHNGIPGATDEQSFYGHRGGTDADGALQISGDPIAGSQIRFSPGGLSVIWAEENSRDAIFEALKRRETYATSGTRPVVRFFAGKLRGVSCDAADFVEKAYQTGTPMGGDIGPVRGRRGPYFAVLAMKDPGSVRFPGTDLQRVQIVKGWVDGNGDTHEQVFDVAGSAENGAGVNPATCAPTGSGAGQLCAVWQDPEFDPAQRAFYYARVLENPTCRWSTLVCKSLGVDPLSSSCAAQAALAGDFENCCLDESNDPFMQPIIQERAWTSPVWVRPEGITRLNAKLRRVGRGRDRVTIDLDLGLVPSGFDPTAEDFTLRISDDDEVYAVTLPAGSLQEVEDRFRFRDRSRGANGVRRVVFRNKADGGAAIALAVRGIDLANADLTGHMVRVDLAFGPVTAQHTRLWTANRNQLQLRD